MRKIVENKWFLVALITVISIIVYYPSLKVPFILDDIGKIVDNPDIRNIENIKTKLIYPYNKNQAWERNDPSRPIVYLTFALNYHFGKLNPFGYHLFNLTIHIFNVILLFILTRKILSFFLIFPACKSSGRQSFNCLIFSIFVSLFFAVHPVNTATVTYIYSRSVELSTFFYLLSLLLFIETEKKNFLYPFSILCFVLALFSRQDTITLPAIILIFDYIFLKNWCSRPLRVSYHIPYWIILVMFLLFRYFYFGKIGDLEATYLPSSFSYFINQVYIILRYMQLLIVPVGLCFDRGPYLPIKSIYELKFLISVIVFVGIFGILYIIFKKKNNISKIVLFSVLFFFITLSPTSSFFSTSTPMFENRLYLSGFGIYLLIVFFYFLLFQQLPNKILTAILVIHIVLLSVITYKRNLFFQDRVLVWLDIVSKYPHPRAFYNVGTYYLLFEKEYSKAYRYLKKAIALKPNYEEAYNCLGFLYFEQKKYDKAIQEFQTSIKINPNYVRAYYNLGVLYYEQKRYDNATEEYQKAIKINPNYEEAYYNLGSLHYEQKKYNNALEEFQKVITINPNSQNAYNNIGSIYYELNQHSNAIQMYKKAIEISPNYEKAYYNLGVVYYNLKMYTEALAQFKFVVKLSPDNQQATNAITMIKSLHGLE